MLGLVSTARAEPRPTEGGLWSFDHADVVERWEDPRGLVRVHYSSDGPNVTRLEDLDADLVPDFVQLVGLTTVDALMFFSDALGMRSPLPESEVGEILGGSEALDVYLVDFAGAADGRFGVDACAPETGHCAGFLVIENDFAGYGYASLEEAVRVVGSHELFHAIQAAYAELPIWMSEGTATWATRRYDDSVPDFINACGGYLRDTGRPLHEPPSGPVPSFAYGTALWWDFISTRNDDALIHDTFVALDGDETATPEALMELAIEDEGDSLLDAWPVFARHNLAAGFRSGVATTYPYAAQLEPIEADAEGATIERSARLYPLAAEYWRIDHEGGPLVFGADAPLDAVKFSLHPVAGFAADGVVGDSLSEWDAEQAGSRVVLEPDPPAGGYWIVAARATLADSSARALVCIGSAEHVAGCGIDPIPEDEAGTDSGVDSGTDTGLDSGMSTSSAGDSEDGTGDSPLDVDSEGSGCGCRASPSEPFGGLVALIAVVLARRRRSEPR